MMLTGNTDGGEGHRERCGPLFESLSPELQEVAGITVVSGVAGPI
jgi:hypothetical protein